MNTNNIIIEGVSYRLVKNERDYKAGDKAKRTKEPCKDRVFTVDLVLGGGVVCREEGRSHHFESIENLK